MCWRLMLACMNSKKYLLMGVLLWLRIMLWGRSWRTTLFCRNSCMRWADLQGTTLKLSPFILLLKLRKVSIFGSRWRTILNTFKRRQRHQSIYNRINRQHTNTLYLSNIPFLINNKIPRITDKTPKINDKISNILHNQHIHRSRRASTADRV